MGNELDKSAFSTALVCIYYYSMTSKNKLNGLISRKFPLLNNKMGVKTITNTLILENCLLPLNNLLFRQEKSQKTTFLIKIPVKKIVVIPVIQLTKISLL